MDLEPSEQSTFHPFRLSWGNRWHEKKKRSTNRIGFEPDKAQASWDVEPNILMQIETPVSQDQSLAWFLPLPIHLKCCTMKDRLLCLSAPSYFSTFAPLRWVVGYPWKIFAWLNRDKD
jgi:hypothetical protein